jgi:hypothetical protein
VQVFPDIGVASYLKNQWADAAFTITSLNDRKPVSGEEDLVILAAPDPPGADDCIRVNRMVPTSTPIVLLNPRIVSGADPPNPDAANMHDTSASGYYLTRYYLR